MTDVIAVLVEPATAGACLEAAMIAAQAIPEGRVEAFHARLAPKKLILVTEEVMTEGRRAELDAALERKSQALQAIVRQWVVDHPAQRPPVWNEVRDGTVDAIIAGRGKTAGLVVLARAEEAEAKEALHAAIFETGRLLLVVPPDAAVPPFGRHVAIAWKADKQAERAITAAIPWLKQAERVSLLQVGEQDTGSLGKAAALLDPHGVSFEPVMLAPGDGNIGARLLGAAHSIGADSLVMGAYRHSRIREMILGGVTRHMLHHAGLPIFMLH